MKKNNDYAIILESKVEDNEGKVETMSVNEVGQMVKDNPLLMKYLESDKKIEDLSQIVVSMLDANKKMGEDLTAVKTMQNRMDNDFRDAVEVIDGVKTSQETMRDKFDTMAHDNTGTFDLYKSTARKRVWTLVGNKAGSLKHTLFYRSFISKIYSDVYNHFGANNSGAIRMEDSHLATEMIKKWRPSKRYVSDKIKEFNTMQANGTLKEPRDSALDKFMEVTNGGRNVEF